MKRKIGIHELYRKHPDTADALLWDRRSDPVTRRGFIRDSGLAAMCAALGSAIPFAHLMPAGLIPAAMAETTAPFELPGKNGLIVLNDRPVNAETPAHLLDDRVTPVSRLFVRNNGLLPESVEADTTKWRLRVDGESCIAPRSYSLEELRSRFEVLSLQLQIECGGNGRAEFNPPARGNQWTTGAIGCPVWTGVRLRDILDDCGYRDDAKYVAYEGADRHLSGDPDKLPISRGVPMSKALEHESLVAWAINDGPLPPLHGYPLRLICAGWPASVSGKWLKRLLIRDREHDGPKMQGQSYRVPCRPVAPGNKVADADMCMIQSMPVKSLVTSPRSGSVHALAEELPVRGHAWAGDRIVYGMLTSIDFGATWQPAELEPPVNRLAWQHWSTRLMFSEPGYYEIWARAVDSDGVSQPMVLPGWNPRGYLNNACHRIAVRITA